MTLKYYTAVRLIVVILLSVFIAQAIARQDFFWPVVAMMAAMLLLIFLRRRVREIIADERDYALGGTAARWTIQIFSLVVVLCMFLFFSLQDRDPVFEAMASVLAYSTCGLMLLYSIIFTVLCRRSVPHG